MLYSEQRTLIRHLAVSQWGQAMNPFNELRAGLCALAKRSVGLLSACGNEESTKLYLALPMLGLLG